MAFVSPGSDITPESAAAARASVANFFQPFAATLVKPVVQLPRSFMAGLSGLTGNTQAEADWSRPLNLPYIGQLKGLSATPGDVQRYNTQTPGETAAQAVDFAATTLPAVGINPFTKVGANVASKVVPKAASPLLKKVVSKTAQAGADFAFGSAAGAAGSYAQGERDNGKLLQSALLTGGISAALPLAIEGTVAGGKFLKKTVGGAASDRLAQAETNLANKISDTKAKSLAPVTVEDRLAKVASADTSKRSTIQKLQEAASSMKESLSSVDAAKLKAIQTLRDAKTYFVDSDAPVLAMSDKMRRLGLEDQAKALEDAVGDTRAARTMGFGRALEDDNALRQITGGDPKVGAGVDQLLELRTRLDTANRDGNAALAESLQGDINKVKAAFSPEDAAKVEAGANLSVQQNDQNLQRLVDNGIISKEAADTYRKTNPNYSKIYDLEHVIEKTHGPGVGAGKDVAETGVKMRQEVANTAGRAAVDAREANAINKILTDERIARNGRTLAMVDADTKAGTGMFKSLWTEADEQAKNEALGLMNQHAGVKNALQEEISNVKKGGAVELAKQKAADLAEANRQASLTRGLGKGAADRARKEYLEAASRGGWDFIRQATDDELRPLVDELALTNEAKSQIFGQLKSLRDKAEQASREGVSVFRNGTQEFYKPTDPRLQRYFDGQQQDWGKVWDIAKKMGDYTRILATQVNPVFSLKNFIRDQQSRLSNLDLPWTYGDMAKATGAAKDFVEGKANPIATRALKLGGSMFSADFKRTGADDISKLAETLIQRKPDAGVFGRIRQISDVSELSTRINIMLAAERAGIKDPAVIRKMMREATLDFNAAGTFVRELNKGVPFFNAGIQGLRTTLNAIAKDPAGFTRRQQILAIYPQILLDGHNKQFDTYNKVSDEEKRLYHIYMLGEGKDADGNTFPKYIKIPKGEGNRVFANITKIITNENIPWDKKGRLIVNEFGSATPLQGEVFSTGNSNGVPVPVPIPGGAITSALIGAFFNKDWKGNYIVDPNLLQKGNPLLERSASTPQAMKDLADTVFQKTGLRLSPKRTDYLLRTIGSGLGSQAYSALSKGYDVATGADKGAKDQSTAAAMATTPFFNAFVGASGNSLPVETSMANREAQTALGDVEWKANRKRDEIIQTLTKLPDTEAKKKFIEEGLANKSFSKEDVDNVMKYAKRKQYSEGISPSDPQDLKGAKLYNRLQGVTSPEEKKALLLEMAKAGTINKTTAIAYQAYKAYQDAGGASASPEELKTKLKEMAAAGQLNPSPDFANFLKSYIEMDRVR